MNGLYEQFEGQNIQLSDGYEDEMMEQLMATGDNYQ